MLSLHPSNSTNSSLSFYLAMISDSTSLSSLLSLDSISFSVKSVKKNWLLLDMHRHPLEKGDEVECEFLLLSYQAYPTSPSFSSKNMAKSRMCVIPDHYAEIFSSLKGKQTVISSPSQFLSAL